MPDIHQFEGLSGKQSIEVFVIMSIGILFVGIIYASSINESDYTVGYNNGLAQHNTSIYNDATLVINNYNDVENSVYNYACGYTDGYIAWQLQEKNSQENSDLTNATNNLTASRV